MSTPLEDYLAASHFTARAQTCITQKKPDYNQAVGHYMNAAMLMHRIDKKTEKELIDCATQAKFLAIQREENV